MKGSVSVFGLGYVGAVTAACLAHKGNHDRGVDLSSSKVEGMEAGHSPIVEPRVSELFADCHKACRLHATTDAEAAVLKTEISFLCVGTSSLRNGKLDLGHVEPVCREIGEALKEKGSFQLVVLRSTVCARHGRKHRRSGENVIPRIGSLFCKRLGEVLAEAEVVVIETRGVKKEELQKHLRAGPHRDRPGELGEGPPACGQFQLRGHLLVES